MNGTWRDMALCACRFLGDAANGRVVLRDRLPDEKALLGFAKVHRIETLVSSALRASGIDDNDYHTLHEVADTAAFHQTKNELISADVLEALEASGVNAFPLKGVALQAVYPDGWVRTSTDTDIFVSKDRLGTAAAVLTDKGFTQFASHDGEFGFQKPPRTVIELHTTLGGYSKKQRDVLARLSKTAFTVNEHYVYTLFHLYKHILYAGAGVRLFWDLYCLSRAALDRPTVEQWLDELELLPFERAVVTVNGILFDGCDCTDDMADVIDLILTSGTFGTGETYHAIKHLVRPITHKSRVRAWIDDHCFDKKAMTARYPVLERHGWLYPVCVIRRVVHGVIFKRTVLQKAAEVEHAADRKRMMRALKAMNIL